MSNRPSPDWDPRDASVLRDQQGAYDEMREACPIAYSDFAGWSLFQHRDLVSVLGDPGTYSNATQFRAVPNGMDPPEHTCYRPAFDPYFGSDEMAGLEPRCRTIAAELTQALLGRPEVEFVAEFAQPFSLRTLCSFLGWPSGIWEELRGWTRHNQEAGFSQDADAGAELARQFAGYVTEALRIRREAGARADLTACLLGVTVEGTALSDGDIVALLRNWTAGHGTVTAALGNLVFHLAGDVHMQQALRGEPQLLPAAIDEILRADGPLLANRRTTTRDVVIGGRTIGHGEKISLDWTAANRDGQVFDDPGAIHLDRSPEGNLLFGKGIHNCQGAPLARLEMRVALEELLAATTAIEFGTAAAPKRDAYPSNGFRSLPVRLR